LLGLAAKYDMTRPDKQGDFCMTWNVTPIQQIVVPTDEARPGFNLQEEGRSPSVAFLFENEKTANEARELLLKIVALSATIIHNNRSNEPPAA
jgi:hypothetical protein